MGLLSRHPRLRALADCRPRDRGGVRAHGDQEGDLRQARRASASPARSSPPTPRTSTSTRSPRSQAAGGRHRPALLLAGQRDAAVGNRARRKDLQARDRHRRCSSRKQDRQDRRCWSASATASSATACWRSASARRRSSSAGRRDALGRRPRALRLRLAHGPVRDERPGRPRHRLESRRSRSGATIRDVLCEMDRRGQKTGAGYYDYDENRNAKPSPVTEKIIKRLRRRSRHQAPRRSPTRRSWSAASIR